MPQPGYAGRNVQEKSMTDTIVGLEPAEGNEPGDVAPKMVPLASYQAEKDKRQARDIEIAELRGRDAGRKEAKVEPQREFTRAELQQQVDDGRMTPDDSDRILSEQSERKIEERVSQRIESDAQQKDLSAKIQAEVSRYTEARPDIMVEGSDDRALVEREFRRQVNELGKPEDQGTELSALMTLFGPSSQLQNGRSKELQTHPETGSDGGDNESGSSTGWYRTPAPAGPGCRRARARGEPT